MKVAGGSGSRKKGRGWLNDSTACGVGCKAMLREVEGFLLALNYTAEDRKTARTEARKRERLKQRCTLSLLSCVSKQMSTRLFSLLQYKGLLTKKNPTQTDTEECTHAHRSGQIDAFWLQ